MQVVLSRLRLSVNRLRVGSEEPVLGKDLPVPAKAILFLILVVVNCWWWWQLLPVRYMASRILSVWWNSPHTIMKFRPIKRKYFDVSIIENAKILTNIVRMPVFLYVYPLAHRLSPYA